MGSNVQTSALQEADHIGHPTHCRCAGGLQPILRYLSQPEASDRWHRARQRGPLEAGRECRSLGTRDREASCRVDAAARKSTPRCGHLSRHGRLAGSRNRPRMERQSDAWPNQRRSIVSTGLSTNNAIRDLLALDPAKRRCAVAAAGRRDGRRQLRQRCGSPDDFDGPPGTVLIRRASGHAAGDGSSARRARRSRRSRFRCTSCRTIGRAKICRSDLVEASPFGTTFPSTANTSSRFVFEGSIRTTSWAWGGPSSSTSGSMAGC